MWEALTGERLFPPLDTRELIAQILMRDHPTPSRQRKGVPASLDATVMRGLARDPENRYATAHDMAAELERIAAPATPREIGAWVKETADNALTARAAAIADIEVVTLADTPNQRRSNPSFAPPSQAPECVPDSDRGTAKMAPFEELDGADGGCLEWPPPKRSRLVAQWLGAAAAALIGAGMLADFAHWSGTSTPASARAAREGTPPAASTIPSRLLAPANSASIPITPLASPAEPSSTVAPTTPSAAPSSMPQPAVRPRNPVHPAAPAIGGAERASHGDCQPPYTVDASGVRIPKRWCS
jgi:serine/threonine-protein kinase